MLTSIVNQEFWTSVYRDALNWLVLNAPSIFIIIIVFIIALRLLNYSISKLKNTLLPGQLPGRTALVSNPKKESIHLPELFPEQEKLQFGSFF